MADKGFSRRAVLRWGLAGVATAAAPTVSSSFSTAFARTATTLTWMGWGGSKRITGIAQAVDKRLPSLGSQYSINIVDGGPNDQSVAAAIRLRLASGTDLPEIVQFNRTQIAEFADAGELLDLGSIYAGKESDLYSGARDLVTVDGTFVAVPLGLNGKLFYYRGDLFEKAGVDAEAIRSVDELINAGRAIQEKANSNILNLGPQPVAYWPGELISAYPGARFFADKNGQFQIGSSPAFKESFAFLKQLYASNVTLKVDDFNSDWQPAIAQGKVASFLNAVWLRLFLPKFAPDQAGLWKVTAWPQLTPLADQRFGSEAGGSVFVVLKRAKNAAAAADFLRQVFLDATGAFAVFQDTGVTPLIRTAKDEFLAAMAKPQRPAGMSDRDFALQPANYFGPKLAEAELASYDRVKVLGYDPAASRGLDIINQWLRKYMADDVDLDTALSSANADMEAQIGNPYAQ